MQCVYFWVERAVWFFPHPALERQITIAFQKCKASLSDGNSLRLLYPEVGSVEHFESKVDRFQALSLGCSLSENVLDCRVSYKLLAFLMEAPMSYKSSSTKITAVQKQ